MICCWSESCATQLGTDLSRAHDDFSIQGAVPFATVRLSVSHRTLRRVKVSWGSRGHFQPTQPRAWRFEQALPTPLSLLGPQPFTTTKSFGRICIDDIDCTKCGWLLPQPPTSGGSVPYEHLWKKLKKRGCACNVEMKSFQALLLLQNFMMWQVFRTNRVSLYTRGSRPLSTPGLTEPICHLLQCPLTAEDLVKGIHLLSRRHF